MEAKPESQICLSHFLCAVSVLGFDYGSKKRCLLTCTILLSSDSHDFKLCAPGLGLYRQNECLSSHSNTRLGLSQLTQSKRRSFLSLFENADESVILASPTVWRAEVRASVST